MAAEKAKSLYLGKTEKKHNCAEAVVAAFDKDCSDFSNCGSGKAPGGWCGAAHAASSLSNAPDDVEKTFRESAGCVTCLGIRQARKMSCVACVEMGARLVQELG